MKSFALQFLVGLAVKMISLMEKRPKILNLKFWASSVKFQRLTTILIFECFVEQYELILLSEIWWDSAHLR